MDDSLTPSPDSERDEMLSALIALRDEHLCRYCRTKKDGVSDLPPVIQRANDAIHRASLSEYAQSPKPSRHE